MASTTRKTVGGTAAAMAIAAAFIAQWEGSRTHAYLDSVGIATVCIGHTHNVHMGDVATPAQCQEYLRGDLGDALATVQRCVHVPLTDNQLAALTSFQFNTGAICRAKLTGMANSGAYPAEWCPKIGNFVYAGGRRVQGLVNRRAAEVKLCLTGD